MAEIDAILYDVINKSQAASRKINLALDINPVSVKNVFKYNSADTQSRLSLKPILLANLSIVVSESDGKSSHKVC